MDPLSAFSLACGIIQVVDFSCKVVSKTKHIYERGSLEENDDIEYLGRHLTNLNAGLQAPHHQTSHTDGQSQVQPQEQRTLSELAFKCSTIAQELVRELEEVKVLRTDSRSKKLGKAYVTFRKKSKLEKLKKSLVDFQCVLDSKILLSLR